MTDLYSEWRDFYAEKVRSWMSLEELRAECGKLQTADSPSPELLLVHAMHALEELRAEVERLRTDGASAVRWAPGSAYWSEVLRELFGPDARKGIDALEARYLAALERADTAEALLRQALDALERGAWDTLRGRNAAEAIRNHLGVKND